MSKFKSLLVLSLFALLFAGCGADGKDGSDGADGAQGPAGEAGLDGKDGANAALDAEQCMACHNGDSELAAKILQYSGSGHADNHSYDRNGTSCAKCHTNEGFNEYAKTGENPKVAPENPTPQSCRTCHNIHENYDSTDYNLKTTEPVEIALVGETVDFGTANVCAECHQPRTSYAIPSEDSSKYIITSTRFGPHHGAQASLFAGLAGFEGKGTAAYKNSSHTGSLDNACVDCHMSAPVGGMAGGHQMGMEFDDHGSAALNTSGCTECHDDDDPAEDKVATVQADVKVMMDSLQALLYTAGVVDSLGGTVKDTFTVQEAGALWNLRTIQEDGSMGVHNYKYTKALLENSIEDLQP